MSYHSKQRTLLTKSQLFRAFATTSLKSVTTLILHVRRFEEAVGTRFRLHVCHQVSDPKSKLGEGRGPDGLLLVSMEPGTFPEWEWVRQRQRDRARQEGRLSGGHG